MAFENKISTLTMNMYEIYYASDPFILEYFKRIFAASSSKFSIVYVKYAASITDFISKFMLRLDNVAIYLYIKQK